MFIKTGLHHIRLSIAVISCFLKGQIFDLKSRKNTQRENYKYNVRLKRFNIKMLTEVIVQEAKAKHGKSAYCSPFAPKMIVHTLYDHINTLYNAIK